MVRHPRTHHRPRARPNPRSPHPTLKGTSNDHPHPAPSTPCGHAPRSGARRTRRPLLPLRGPTRRGRHRSRHLGGRRAAPSRESHRTGPRSTPRACPL
nr:MAG TPA: hypothetical protein [Caudoviricetes sp.]